MGPVFNFLYCVATNGTGYHLLKVGSKRRRTKAEIKDDQMEEMMKEDHLNNIINRSKRLERELVAA